MIIRDDEIDEVVQEEVLPEDIQEEEVIVNSETSEESEEPATIQDEEEEEDRVVLIGDEAQEEVKEEHSDPDIVKKLRKVTRGLEKKNKALQKQIDANAKAAEDEKPIELGEEPTLASCKYDDVKFKQEIIAYDSRKRKVEEQAAQKAKAVEDQNKKWQNRQEQYVNLKKEHGFKDFGEVEDIVSSTLSQTQQGIIVQGTDDSALVVYALGKHPKKLEEMSKITDPVEFAVKIGKLESQLNVKSRKAPAPEKRVPTGKAGGITGNTDKTLDRLREEAYKTGDMTKVVAYKKKLKSKG